MNEVWVTNASPVIVLAKAGYLELLLGTLGIVLRAKKLALVSQAADVLKALRIAGLHLDDGTIRLALESIGETW